MPDPKLMLGQDAPDADWTSLLYLLIFLVFPALKAFGEWIRKRWGKQEEEGDEFEVIIEDDESASPGKQVPPYRPQTLAGPPPVRTLQSDGAYPLPPVAKPIQPPRPAPARPVVQRPQPARAVLARPIRPRPAPSGSDAQYDVVYEADYDVEYKADYDTGYGELAAKRHARKAGKTEKVDGPPPARLLLAGARLDAAGLRKAVILSEILSPPIALRTRSNTPFGRPE